MRNREMLGSMASPANSFRRLFSRDSVRRGGAGWRNDTSGPLRGASGNPSMVEAWNNLGNTLVALERHAEAIECYQRALDLKPDLFETWYNAGNTCVEMEDYEEAVRYYNHALPLRQDRHKVHYNLAYA